MEDVWHEIAEEAIKKAEQVPVSIEEFIEGLKQVAQEVMDRAAAG